MRKDVIKIGFAPTKRDVFNHPEAHEVKKRIRAEAATWLADNVRLVDIDDVTPSGLVETEDNALAVAEKFAREGVAGIFTPHCNFGSEGNVCLVASKLRVPVLLWGPRDGDPSTQTDFTMSAIGRTRDSQCGLFATGKALRRVNVPFTYIPNTTLESGVIKKGFQAFAAVCAVVKAFRETKILQISTRPDPFWTVMYNEGELLERFGIRVFPVTLVDLVDMIELMEKERPDKVREAAAAIRGATPPVDIKDESILRMGAYFLAVQELCAKHHCNAAATSCWRAFRKATGIAACAMNGYVAQEGLPVACETDIHGAISSRMLQAAAMYTDPIFFADVTIRHPTNDNAELLWHCGNFPPCFAAGSDDCSLQNSTMAGVPSPGKSFFNMREGDVTVCRFDGDHGKYSMLMGQGKSIAGPKTVGSYCWFEVKDWVKWEEKLVTGPYIHHVAGTYGKLAPILHEACKYLGIDPDSVEPEEEWIREFWRGRA